MVPVRGYVVRLPEGRLTDPHLVLSDRVPGRDLAVLLCNKSNAFFNLGKWNEAFLAAKECLQWDPTYVKVWRRGPLPDRPPPLPSFATLSAPLGV